MQITGYIKWIGVTEERTREDFVQKSDFAHSNPEAFKQACGGEPYFSWQVEFYGKNPYL